MIGHPSYPAPGQVYAPLPPRPGWAAAAVAFLLWTSCGAPFLLVGLGALDLVRRCGDALLVGCATAPPARAWLCLLAVPVLGLILTLLGSSRITRGARAAGVALLLGAAAVIAALSGAALVLAGYRS